MIQVSNEKKGLFKSLTKFIRDVRAEMRKVTWPNRKELFAYTAVVFVSVALAAFLIWVVDIALGQVLGLIIR